MSQSSWLKRLNRLEFGKPINPSVLLLPSFPRGQCAVPYLKLVHDWFFLLPFIIKSFDVTPLLTGSLNKHLKFITSKSKERRPRQLHVLLQFTLEQAMKALALDWVGWLTQGRFNARQRHPAPHCTVCWVDTTADLDGCGTHQDSMPGPSSP